MTLSRRREYQACRNDFRVAKGARNLHTNFDSLEYLRLQVKIYKGFKHALIYFKRRQQ